MSVTDGALKAPAERPAPRVNGLAAPPPVAAPTSVLTADRPTEIEARAHRAQAQFFAELVTHRTAATPFCLGLFGSSGSGKSSLLGALRDRVAVQSEAAAQASDTAFLGGVAPIHVAVQAGASPAAALVHQVFAALAPAFPRLVAEASHAGLDPRAAASEAGDRLNEVRQRLDVERGKLDDLSGRHARLTDTVLFESSGSRFDAYARTNRARIERSLRRFGFDPDIGAAYRALVRDASEPGGALARGPGWLRAFWVYRGQTRLIVVALVLFALAWGVGWLMDNQGPLIDWLRASNDKMAPTADWLQSHMHWLEPVKTVLALAGVAALALNVWRSVRFLQPIVKGAALLRGDVDRRRRDLDGHLAHQTQRVDSLAREAEAASQLAGEAETRLATRATEGRPPRLAALANGASEEFDTARAFFGAISAAIGARANDRLPSSGSAALTRLVLCLDGFESVSSERAAEFLACAHALLSQPGFVTVIAADRSHIVTGLGDTDPALAASRLDRMVQVPFAVGSSEDPWPASRGLVRMLLGGETASPAPEADAPPTNQSALDRPWLPSEGAVLEALAPLAGTTPRAIKRFVNVYRVARADPAMDGASAQELAALAVGLALEASGAPIDPRNPSAYGGLDDPALKARSAVSGALGVPFNAQDAARGFETARAYGTRS